MLKVNKKRIFFNMAVIGLLIFLYSLGLLKPVEIIVTKLLNPAVEKVFIISSGIRDKYNEQTDKRDLSLIVKKLENEVARLTEENAKFIMTEEENKLLRDKLLFFSNNDYKYVMANVISRGDLADIVGRTETVIINKGRKDGIYEGLAVIAGKGTIIGKITEAKEEISKVELVNNEKCKIAATILNGEKTTGITQGELGLTIRMDFIPQSEAVKADDIVVTSGLEQAIPRGLVIGKVSDVNKENNDLWQTARLNALFDPSNLVIVSVLIP
jgi:rod shape-determining protein MreC